MTARGVMMIVRNALRQEAVVDKARLQTNIHALGAEATIYVAFEDGSEFAIRIYGRGKRDV